MASRNPVVRDRLRGANSDLSDCGRNPALLCARSAIFSFLTQQTERTAGAFCFHSTFCRTWRRTRLARIRAAAVTKRTHALDREHYPRSGLVALAFATFWN